MTGIAGSVSPGRFDVPEDLKRWAGEIAAINADLSEDGLLVKDGYRLEEGGTVSLYGGHGPVAPHVDVTPEELGDRTPFPVWGFMLTCPEGTLHRHDGSDPIATGSAYVLDPRESHSVACSPGCIAFLATWGWNPEDVFADLDAFAGSCLGLASRLHAETPDAGTFMEHETGMEGLAC